MYKYLPDTTLPSMMYTCTPTYLTPCLPSMQISLLAAWQSLAQRLQVQSIIPIVRDIVEPGEKVILAAAEQMACGALYPTVLGLVLVLLSNQHPNTKLY